MFTLLRNLICDGKVFHNLGPLQDEAAVSKRQFKFACSALDGKISDMYLDDRLLKNLNLLTEIHFKNSFIPTWALL